MASRPTGYRAWSRDEHMKFRELTKLLGPNIEWISFFMEGRSDSNCQTRAALIANPDKKRTHKIIYQHQSIHLGYALIVVDRR
mmetsp:Transcript_9831/g.22367  ORF Transcript_9831/g.22367 Transcript_9831/m.22367 type:complete len:83 (-) Transcript_9831:8-256(-)